MILWVFFPNQYDAMPKVQENDGHLKASVGSVIELIGKEIAATKQEGQATASDLAMRIDTKLVEMQGAIGGLAHSTFLCRP